MLDKQSHLSHESHVFSSRLLQPRPLDQEAPEALHGPLGPGDVPLHVSCPEDTFDSLKLATVASATWAKEIIVTQTIDLYTTICPVNEKQTVPTAITTAHPLRTVTITSGLTLSSCPTPIVGKFTPPTGVEPPKEHTTTSTEEVASETAISLAIVTASIPSSADNATALATLATSTPL
ncbi:hypothetical protein QQX98_006567 [Neonectria punicea]|uniref:Uncharacterized protein n=1 Tax=Neonectria punicea TaxID=979145 RepID=A0ABR1H0B1_9HYPO